MSNWYHYNQKPKPVKNGFQTINKRGSFANTWQSKLWLSGIVSSSDTARMGRGRSYIRKGQISDIKIRLGEIKGMVQGTRSKPYSILIKFPIWSTTKWQQFISDIIKEGSIYASILSGDFPPGLESFLVERNFFFATIKELKYNCSCPDWGKPCKHVAALIYALVEIIDEDPHIMFLIRGCQKQTFSEMVKEGYTKSVFDPLKETRKSRIITKSNDVDTNIDDKPIPEKENYQISQLTKISNFMEKEVSSYNELNSSNKIDANLNNFFQGHHISMNRIEQMTSIDRIGVDGFGGELASHTMKTWIGDLKEEMKKTGLLINLLINDIKDNLCNVELDNILFDRSKSKKTLYKYKRSFYDCILIETVGDSTLPKPKIELNHSNLSSDKNHKTIYQSDQRQLGKLNRSKKAILNELREISGIGPRTAENLIELGVQSTEDLVFKIDTLLDNNVIPNKTMLVYSTEAKSILNLLSSNIQSVDQEMERKEIIDRMCTVEGVNVKWANTLYTKKIRSIVKISLIDNLEFYKVTKSRPSIPVKILRKLIDNSFSQLVSEKRISKNYQDAKRFDRLLNTNREVLRLDGVGPVTLKRLKDIGIKNLLELAFLTDNFKKRRDRAIPFTTLQRLRIAARSYIIHL